MSDLVVDRLAGLFGEDASATFSADRTYRYLLTRTWREDAARVVFVMLNPSTADAFTVDPTIHRCMSFACSWLAGGIIVVNLFGLRATDPTALRTHPDPVGPDNDRILAEQLAGQDYVIGPVVCAWGAHAMAADRARQVEALLRARGVQPLCLGMTKGGHPRHPLYVPAVTATVEYPVCAVPAPGVV